MKDARSRFFKARILDWSQSHPRPYPWRSTTSPFAVLIAEVMLRRTRADQVAPVFMRFINRFPDPARLAAASDDDVCHLVRPLGLAWRVPAFKHLGTALVRNHDGEVPADRDELMALPGVGDYVAAAVRAFAFNLPTTLADTNTVRVTGRFFGFPYHAESRRNVEVRAQIDWLLDPNRPRDSARALLDFASVVCQARQPRCTDCPVVEYCSYGTSRIDISRGCTA